MRAYVIHRSEYGDNAIICDTSTNGPDRKSAVPIKIALISDQSLAVDGRPRKIISTTHNGDGAAMYLIDFNMCHLRNRTWRLALAQASPAALSRPVHKRVVQ